MDASARWATLQTLLETALDLPEAERAAFVAEHTAGAPGLGDELEDLLRAADAVPAFLDAAPAWSLSEGDGAEPNLDGRRIGPYRIVRELGRGGQGRVFLAERDDVGSRVALKVLRGGLAAPDLLRRFLTERRVLAGLDHPNVARLLDAGTLDDGATRTPYFVMEAVEGQPITTYVREHDLTVGDRLDLFLQVCDAVAFAHRRLVVHRDLKPSNVFVTAEGQVKLLDFGVAKLLDEAEGDEPLTRTGHRLLTPEYAAPEQVLGGEVTVATDVYALGVLLYDLLADARPYDTTGGLRAVVRAVCDEMPPPPSATAVPDHARALRGDLDAIVLRALAKAPEDRYASVDALADDLRRQRDGLPVRARRQTVGYRAARYVRRHAVGVGLGVLVAGLAIAFVVRERALRVEAEAARTEAEATADLLVDLFGAAGGGEGGEFRPDTLRALNLVDRAARRLDERTDYGPALKGALTLRLGELYDGIWRPVESLARYREAERLARQAGDAEGLAYALVRVGFRLTASDRCAEALPALDQAVRLYRSLDTAPIEVADAFGGRGAALACLGRYDAAVADLGATQQLLDGRPDDGGFVLHSLADFLDRAGHAAEAEATLRASIARGEALYPRGHSVITARRDMLSHMLAAHGDLVGAEREARRSYDDIRSRHGAIHGRTIGAQIQLARVLRQRSKLAEADPLTAALVEAADQLPATDVVGKARAHDLRAHVLLDLGRLGEAEAEARAALALPRPPDGSFLGDHVAQYRTLRDVLARAGRADEAARAGATADTLAARLAARTTG